ncbi:MAG: phosphotransferase [FCB group bacterium]|nr:phosphotransferase [FCB group bacterium]
MPNPTDILLPPDESPETVLGHCFKDCWGFEPESVARLKGDASLRTIYRLKYDGISVIGVFGPNLAENMAFTGFTKTFLKSNLPVPALLYVHFTNKYYLLEDLGDETLFAKLGKLRSLAGGGFPFEQITQYYEKAVDFLSEFQLLSAGNIDYSLCYQTDSFGEEAWKFDHEYFLNSFLDTLYPDYIDRASVEKELEYHQNLLKLYTSDYFLYRDFQSRNIMIKDDNLRFIDYQSGRRGYPSYDIASLLYDARADLPMEFRSELLTRHTDNTASHTALSAGELSEAFPVYAEMRILQALGSYGNNGIRKNNREYIEAMPFALRNIRSLMKEDARLSKMTAVRDIFDRMHEEKPWLKYLNQSRPN